MQDKIIIKGARQHNLKNIDVEIPKNKLVVFTGISGSGKSSLAFDTIYAEGQRRYVESLSSYARQFLGIMDKPEVDSIEGLSPAISINQKSTSHNPRSTVGTVTEIYDYLRLLFARIGHPHCASCGREIERLSLSQIVSLTLELIKKMVSTSGKRPVRLLILSPVIRDRKGEFKDLFDSLRAKGFTKVRIDGHIFGLDEDLFLIKTNKHTIDVVVDRLTIEKKSLGKKQEYADLKARLADSLEQALALSDGLVIVGEVKDAAFAFPEKPKDLFDYLYSEKFACPICKTSISEIEPRMFSFNSPHGACVKCSGIGSLLRVDRQLALNPNLSISEGGILPFAKLILSDTWFGRLITVVCQKEGISTKKPLREVTKKQIDLLLYGTKEEIHEVSGKNRQGKLVTIYETFPGIIPELERRFSETESEYARAEIRKYLREEVCPVCLGKRLKKEALAITIQQKSIVEITDLSIDKALDWVVSLNSQLNTREKIIADLILKEIRSRLSFLVSVGLSYLTLDRSAGTLSAGETQRIRLASQIGSGLSGVLYVLDEPSVGLHPKDNNKLINTLKYLRDLGNTVIVVEHDREMMENADLIADFGPGAGEAGGKIVSFGSPSKIKSDKLSLTGYYLLGKKRIEINKKRSARSEDDKVLTVNGCQENNLKKINISFPLKRLICVTGVSGSGKSSLVVNTLYPILARHFNPFYREKVGLYESVEGIDQIKRVILIDQSPIGRTPRSNPATYTGAFTFVRELFSQVAEARIRGYKPGRFSFNVKGGRCGVCEGEGQTKIEMQFMPDIYVTCDVCGGSRFNSETLDIRYKGKNIAEVLSMTVEEARRFFGNIPRLSGKLDTLYSVGLSYIKLGQPAPQLSGGEAQRVKLASELSKKSTRDSLYILDEPTTGLHFADLEKLLCVLRQLADMGNTVIIIEHNLDVVKNADWIIDLGPEGGDEGGKVVGQGTPKDLANHKSSYTGQFLRQTLGMRYR